VYGLKEQVHSLRKAPTTTNLFLIFRALKWVAEVYMQRSAVHTRINQTHEWCIVVAYKSSWLRWGQGETTGPSWGEPEMFVCLDWPLTVNHFWLLFCTVTSTLNSIDEPWIVKLLDGPTWHDNKDGDHSRTYSVTRAITLLHGNLSMRFVCFA